MVAAQIGIVIIFILIHIAAEKLKFLDVIPRSRWLSAAGGISVAYVFLHVFPELNETQKLLSDKSGILPFIESHTYLIALAGLSMFYGIERMVKKKKEKETEGGIFWIHIISFSIYNMIIGYLLVHREEQNLRGLIFYGIAMSLHFVVNDYGLRKEHQNTYRMKGRWVLASAILAGWLLGISTEISKAALGVLFAILAGGLILNVLKEELPEERESRYSAFAIGVISYAALLITV